MYVHDPMLAGCFIIFETGLSIISDKTEVKYLIHLPSETFDPKDCEIAK